MKKQFLKNGLALIAGLLMQHASFAQSLVSPSLADNLWVSSATPITGLNTAAIDIPLGTLGFPPTSLTQLAACAYLNSAGGGISVKDMISGNVVNVAYPITLGGATMASVPDVILGNVPDATVLGTVAGQDFTMGVAFVNNTGSVEMDYFDIHYSVYGTGGAFTVTLMRQELVPFPTLPLPSGPRCGASFTPLGTVHVDVVADAHTLAQPYGTPSCDHFILVWDGYAATVPHPCGAGNPETWIFSAYGGNPIFGSGTPQGGLSRQTTTLSQFLNNTDEGIEPDVAAVRYDSSGSIRDVGWITYTNSVVNPSMVQNHIWRVNWWPQISWGLNPPCYYTPDTHVDTSSSLYSTRHFFHPRIDGNDDETTNAGYSNDQWKVVYEASPIGATRLSTRSVGDMAPPTQQSNWINLTSVTSSPPLPASYNHYLPTVAFGTVNALSGNPMYNVTTATHVSGFGEYEMMMPIEAGTPGSLALDPSSNLSYFQVNKIAPADMASCNYANSVSTPCNNVSDSPLVAWAVYDAGVPNYKIYYKNTPYNGASSTGYGYRHSVTTTSSVGAQQGVMLYPNPAAGKIVITNPGWVNAGHYTISNMMAQQVAQGTMALGGNEVALGGLAPGCYLVTLYKDGKACGYYPFTKQ